MAIQTLESGCPLVGGMAILDRNLGVLLYLKAKRRIMETQIFHHGKNIIFKKSSEKKPKSFKILLSLYIISLVCPVVIVLSIHSSCHLSIQVPHPGRRR